MYQSEQTAEQLDSELQGVADAAPPEMLEQPEQEAAPAEKPSTRDILRAALDGKPAETAEKPAQTEKPALEAPKPEAEAPKPFKAPQRWSPEAREKFNALDDGLKAQIVDRETFIEKKLEETANDRRIAENFVQAMKPYEAHIRSIGANPYKLVGDLMNLGYTLNTGSTEQGNIGKEEASRRMQRRQESGWCLCNTSPPRMT
jgi:hypothetical protein